MRSDLETVIRLEVEHIFGRRILSSRDCIQLSAEIFRKNKVQLNANTLRRFYKLVKTDYSPSVSTLNILSNYCGFNSVEELNAVKGAAGNRTEAIPQESVLNYFVTLFSHTPVGDDNNETFLSVVRHTIQFLNGNTDLIERFQCLVAKTKNGQDFYFERFINIDRLNTYYGDGLRYYLNEKGTPEARIFVNSLLVLRYWLTENDDKLQRHFQQVTIHEPGFSESPTTYARYFASLLYHAHGIGVSADETIIDIYKYYLSLKPSHNYTSSVCSFELIIGEALILTGFSEEGLQYTSAALKKYGNTDFIKGSVMQSFYLLHTIALYETGSHKSAERVFEQIVPSKFDFLSKKYHTILYLYLSDELKRKVAKYDEQLLVHITETGFARLRQRFCKPVDNNIYLGRIEPNRTGIRL